jgi:hypothetical protein
LINNPSYQEFIPVHLGAQYTETICGIQAGKKACVIPAFRDEKSRVTIQPTKHLPAMQPAWKEVRQVRQAQNKRKDYFHSFCLFRVFRGLNN